MIIDPTNCSLDFNFCTNRIAVGGDISSTKQLLELKSVGITHIINCQSEFNDAVLFTKDLNFNYLWNGTLDDDDYKPTEWFQRAIEFALPALSIPNTKIYCHCFAGINRGPSIAYAILRAQGLSELYARNLIKNVRPHADISYKDDADSAIQQLGY